MAFALAIRNIDTVSHQHMASATITIVMATVILCGGFTTPMLQWLQIRCVILFLVFVITNDWLSYRIRSVILFLACVITNDWFSYRSGR